MSNFTLTEFNFKYWIFKMKVKTKSKFIEFCIGIFLLGAMSTLLIHAIAPNGFIH